MVTASSSQDFPIYHDPRSLLFKIETESLCDLCLQCGLQLHRTDLADELSESTGTRRLTRASKREPNVNWQQPNPVAG